jgi:amidase
MMKRRHFLRCSLAGGAAALTRTAAFPVPKKGEPISVRPEGIPFDWEASITELQEAMTSGELTSLSITEKYLQRIEALDKRGPVLNSVIEVNPEALAIAESLDDKRKTSGPRSLLHGIPVLIKDNIDTADLMMTTAGSLGLNGSVPGQDSFVARRLREAGALILGKTNLSEWANFRSIHSTSGWSGRGGLTKNPYALDRNTSGSSSGSAVAAAANLATVTIGTETDGSIVSPASVCSIVGIKPTVGLVSRAGIIPISHTQDTAGPMARTVADAALLLGVLTGIDPRDAATAASKGKFLPDYSTFLDPQGLKGARIGVARKFFGFNDRVDKLINEALDVMKQLGAVLIDPADLPSHGKFNDPEYEVMLYEFKANLNAYFAGLGPQAPLKSLKEAIAFNEENREREMPYFGQEIFIQSEAKGPLTEAVYKTALDKCRRLSRVEGIDAVMQKNKLDAIVAPTDGPAWLTDLVNGDHFAGGCSTPPAVAGYPHITVPAGYVFGLPIGISFFGRAWSEPMLIKLAYAFEQATKLRKPPAYLSTADLSL